VLLEAAVQVADVGPGRLYHLAIGAQLEAEHPVGGGVLGPHVHHHLVGVDVGRVPGVVGGVDGEQLFTAKELTVEPGLPPPPRAGKQAVVFIFITVLLDVIALGVIIPVVQRIVQEFGDEVLCSFAPQYPKSTPASSCNLVPLSVVFVSQSPVHS
jgi:hypothetical protein